MAMGHGLYQFVLFCIYGVEMDKSERAARERQVMDAVGKADTGKLNAALKQTALALKSNFPHYTGVYMYLVEGDTLVLAAFDGRPTEHTRIPVGAGICGRAARIKDTVTVDDVNADSEYLACSLETRSEIVVPILKGDGVLGEIDIDSDVPAAFNDQDRSFLRQVAERLAALAPD